MFHSDRGTQYMAYAFIHLLKDFGVKQSFSRTARPHDNTVPEEFFSILRKNYIGSTILPKRIWWEAFTGLLTSITMNAHISQYNIKFRNRRNFILAQKERSLIRMRIPGSEWIHFYTVIFWVLLLIVPFWLKGHSWKNGLNTEFMTWKRVKIWTISFLSSKFR